MLRALATALAGGLVHAKAKGTGSTDVGVVAPGRSPWTFKADGRLRRGSSLVYARFFGRKGNRERADGKARAGEVTRFAVILAVALLVAGCGGDGREKAVEAAVTWLGAVADRDADRACDLMAESAVDTIRRRSGLDSETTCLGAVRAYSDAFEPGDIDGILEIGLETDGRVKDDEVGVFPRSGPRELQVVLMRRTGDEWKVASLSLGPTEPTPTPTPAG